MMRRDLRAVWCQMIKELTARRRTFTCHVTQARSDLSGVKGKGTEADGKKGEGKWSKEKRGKDLNSPSQAEGGKGLSEALVLDRKEKMTMI
ncbi:hypothetical protein E2C01_082932 [Portunus trituberculatus]|uniref:Uncharacterized protein n=1 Tax=Portunus trituberculatus TaxID=210409 RepID=A0A5B7IVU9_PORTR|nr:hypothetical protein [Portunus trituberculatus]